MGHVTNSTFFESFDHMYFLKKFNLGVPDILTINLVLKLNIEKIKSGNEIIRCAIKYSGLSLFKSFLNLLKFRIKIKI